MSPAVKAQATAITIEGRWISADSRSSLKLELDMDDRDGEIVGEGELTIPGDRSTPWTFHVDVTGTRTGCEIELHLRARFSRARLSGSVSGTIEEPVIEGRFAGFGASFGSVRLVPAVS